MNVSKAVVTDLCSPFAELVLRVVSAKPSDGRNVGTISGEVTQLVFPHIMPDS